MLPRCPSRALTKDTLSVLSFYSHYKNGFLPDSGGLLEQAATFLDAMNIIASAVTEAESAEQAAR